MPIKCIAQPDHTDQGCENAELHVLYDSLSVYDDTHIITAAKMVIEQWMNGSDPPHFVEIKEDLGLSNVDLYQLCWVFAMNSCTPASVLQDLCIGASVALMERIAENSNVSPSTLAMLARNNASDVRIAVGNNSGASLSTIAHLLEDANIDVRFSLAENPHLPKKALQILSTDDNPYVRCRAEATMSRIAS